MADFGVPSLAQVWLLAGVPLMGFTALLIAAIAGIISLRRATVVTPGLSVGGRAMAVALALPVFPLIPIACVEAQVRLDLDLISTLAAWASVALFAGGCVWLVLGRRSIQRPPA